MSLRPPPKRETPSRIVARFTVLLIMVGMVGLAVWSAVINQRIPLIETQTLADLDLEDPSVIDGTTVNVVTEAGGGEPVILLHDVDVAGGVVWDDVVSVLDERFTPIRVDLPGFGLSRRTTEEGPAHTVSAQARVVAGVIEERHGGPVVLVGVGLGGKVAAELAVTAPHLVRGLVLIDVDFWGRDDLVVFLERLPVVGPAFAHTFEAGGVRGLQRWAPHCEEGGWCPTVEQTEARDRATSVAGTTESIAAFRRTPPASLVPSELREISAPVVYVWSTLGEVPVESVERMQDAIPHLAVTEVEVWRAHLEAPGEVAAAVDTVAG